MNLRGSLNPREKETECGNNSVWEFLLLYSKFLFSYCATSVCHFPFLPLSLPKSDIMVLRGINTSGERPLKFPCAILFPVVLPLVGSVSLLEKSKSVFFFPVGIRLSCLCLVMKFSEIV